MYKVRLSLILNIDLIRRKNSAINYFDKKNNMNVVERLKPLGSFCRSVTESAY